MFYCFRNTVWKVIFKVLNSTSIVPFPQNKLNDFWFDHVDNNLKRTKPFKTRENRVFRNDTAIDSFYTYNVTFNGVIPYKMCDTLELELLKFWRRKDKRTLHCMAFCIIIFFYFYCDAYCNEYLNTI